MPHHVTQPEKETVEVKQSNKWLSLTFDLQREIAIYLGHDNFCKAYRVCKGGFFQAAPVDLFSRILKRPQLDWEFPENPDDQDWDKIKALKKQFDFFQKIDSWRASTDLSIKVYKIQEQIDSYKWNRIKIYAKIALCVFLCKLVVENAPSSEVIMAFVMPFILPLLKHLFNTLQLLEAELILKEEDHNRKKVYVKKLRNLTNNEERDKKIRETLAKPEKLLSKKLKIDASTHIFHNLDTCHYLFSWFSCKSPLPILKANQVINIARVCIKYPTIKNNFGESLIANLMNIINAFAPDKLLLFPLFHCLLHYFPTKTNEEIFLLKEFLSFLVEKNDGEINANMKLRYHDKGGHRQLVRIRVLADIISDRIIRNRNEDDPIYEILNDLLVNRTTPSHSLVNKRP